MNRTIDVERLDLATVAGDLRRRGVAVTEGEVVGRTVLRDAVLEILDCSALEAETIVDTMIGRGFITREATPDGLVGWRVHSA